MSGCLNAALQYLSANTVLLVLSSGCITMDAWWVVRRLLEYLYRVCLVENIDVGSSVVHNSKHGTAVVILLCVSEECCDHRVLLALCCSVPRVPAPRVRRSKDREPGGMPCSSRRDQTVSPSCLWVSWLCLFAKEYRFTDTLREKERVERERNKRNGKQRELTGEVIFSSCIML